MHDHNLKQAIFANPAVAIEISDSDGRITETNAAFRDILGYQESELMSLKVADLCHNDDKERETQERCQLIEGELDHLTFRKRYRTKGGKTLWGDTNVTVARNATGDCEAVVATMVDVTEQRRQELLQQGQTHILDLLYQNRPLEEVCTAIVEAIECVEEGLLCSILQLNTRTGTLHKVAAPSLPDFYNNAVDGMEIGEGVGSCGAAAFSKRRVVVADILSHPYWQKARRLIEKTDLRSCWSQPIFSNNGEVLGTFAIYYTEPREPGPFELELIRSAADLTALAICHKQALSALQRRDQLKSEFLGLVSHKLKTPATAISLFIQNIVADSTDLNDPNFRQMLTMIQAETRHLEHLIQDLLYFSNVILHQDDLKLETFDLGKLVRQIAESLSPAASKKCLDFSIDIDAPFPPEPLQLDRARMTFVLRALLDNAIKFTPNEGSVQLQGQLENGSVKLTVRDTGTGIPKEEMGKIFSKFYQVDPSSSGQIRGFGLGLFYAQEFVRSMHGELTVESQPDFGTVAAIRLPVPS
jgi:PAS domain S-box-containing protein